MNRFRGDGGYTAILTALALLFLLGAAALAVDSSMFFQQARAEQRVADLACLAGVQELPEDPVSAVQKAAEFIKPNHPSLAGLTLTSSTPPVSTYSVGAFQVEIETPWNGKATQMRVAVSQIRDTHFGRAIGTSNAEINQVAYCEVGSALGGAVDQPFGLLPGFTGGIINFGKNDCTLNGQTSSACSGLAIPRHDDPEHSADFPTKSTNNYITNMILGINWEIDTSSNQVCETVSTQYEPCNQVATISGDDPSHIYNGLIEGKHSLGFVGDEIGYLEKHHAIYDHGGDFYDGHELGDIATCVDGAGNPMTCPSPWDAVAWETQIAGGSPPNLPVFKISEISDCDCPRFTRVPVVSSFPASHCSITDPNDPDQINKCTATIVDFQWLFLLRPFFNGSGPIVGPDAAHNDFDNSGGGQTVRTISAVRIDVSDAVITDNGCFSPFKEGSPKAVRLIDG
jgi:hypothetical protein